MEAGQIPFSPEKVPFGGLFESLELARSAPAFVFSLRVEAKLLGGSGRSSRWSKGWLRIAVLC